MENLPWVTALIALSLLNTILGRHAPPTENPQTDISEDLRRAETDLSWFIGIMNDQKARLYAINGLLIVLGAFEFSDIAWLKGLTHSKADAWFAGLEASLGLMLVVIFGTVVSSFGFDAPALREFSRDLRDDRVKAIGQRQA